MGALLAGRDPAAQLLAFRTSKGLTWTTQCERFGPPGGATSSRNVQAAVVGARHADVMRDLAYPVIVGGGAIMIVVAERHGIAPWFASPCVLLIAAVLVAILERRLASWNRDHGDTRTDAAHFAGNLIASHLSLAVDDHDLPLREHLACIRRGRLDVSSASDHETALARALCGMALIACGSRK